MKWAYNAVAEATFKIIKTEFVKGSTFDTLEALKRELHYDLHWLNHLQIHGTLDLFSPIEYNHAQLELIKFCYS